MMVRGLFSGLQCNSHIAGPDVPHLVEDSWAPGAMWVQSDGFDT